MRKGEIQKDDLNNIKNKTNSTSENGDEIKKKTHKSEKNETKSIKHKTEKEITGLKEEINKLKEENKELKDALLRKAAEFENYKKRTENEQSNLIKFGAESFILSVLPIYDDMRRSLEHIDNSDKLETLKEGMKLVFDKFTKALKEQGIKKIEAKGKPFDVNYHEALMQQPIKGVPPHTVIEEIEPGYFYKDKVIKHTKVIVSMETTDNESISVENNHKQKE